MKIAVVGAGAIGGWLAARLALAGEDVSVLARGATLARIARHGIELHSGGVERRVAVNATADPATLGPQDAVFVCVKATALPALAPTLAGLMHRETMLLSAANGLPWWYFLPPGVACQGLRLQGVDANGALERAIALHQVLGVSVFASCASPQPGVVVHRAGARLVVGEPTGGRSARSNALAERLRNAGFEAENSADIRREIWIKLLGNACFNPVSLITGSPTDEMIDDPKLHALFMRMMEEAIGVGGRLGLAIDVEPARRIAQTRQFGNVKTSMLQDLEAGRTVEIDAILGSLVECAAAVAMPVPMLDAVLGLARHRARHAGLPAA